MCYCGLEVMHVKPLKTKLSITLDENVAQGVRQLAEADDRSVSQYINLLLRQHITTQMQPLPTCKEEDSAHVTL